MPEHELAERTRKNFRRRDSKHETRGAGFSVSRAKNVADQVQQMEASDPGRTQQIAARLTAIKRAQQHGPNRDLG